MKYSSGLNALAIIGTEQLTVSRGAKCHGVFTAAWIKVSCEMSFSAHCGSLHN